jgi:surface antigen
MHFLKDSLLSELNKQEVQEFKQFIREALDTLEDEKVVTWRAKTSSISGKYKSKFTYKSGDTTCRRSLFLMENKNKREPYQFDICKSGDRWVIQDTAARAFRKSDWAMLRNSVFSALDEGPIGSPFSWHNTKTGNAGSHVIVSQSKSGSKYCKNIAITIFNKQGESSNGVYTFCKSNAAESIWNRRPRVPEL